jgi:hypothetical protein
MMGADGLKAKIEYNLRNKKVGYTELFSRYGSRYQSVVPEGKEQSIEFIRHQLAMVAKANGAENIQDIILKSDDSLRRIHIEVKKQKKNAESA